MRFQDSVKNLLLSNESNDHRPHILRPHFLLGIALCLLLIKVSLSYDVFLHTQLIGVKKDITSETIYGLTNEERQKFNLSGLTYNTVLEEAAKKKAQHMLDNDYWSHNSPDGVTPWHWFRAVGYEYEEAGENLAVDFETPSGVMKAWMNSPSHRANILEGTYTEIGVGVLEGEFQGKTSVLVVQLFGLPKESTVIYANEEVETVDEVNNGDKEPPRTSITPPPGSYENRVIVTLDTNEIASTYITTDGTMPTVQSKKYDGPLELSSNTTITYFSVDSANNAETIKTAFYQVERAKDNDFTVIYPTENTVLNSTTLVVTGNAEPGEEITILSDDQELRSKTVNASGHYQISVEMPKEGLQRLKVTNGSKTKQILTIVDTTPPEFQLLSKPTFTLYENHYDMNVEMTATTSDIVTMMLQSETETPMNEDEENTFTATVPVPIDAEEFSFNVIATDRAGNQNEETYTYELPQEIEEQVELAQADLEDEIVTGTTEENGSVRGTKVFASSGLAGTIFKWIAISVLLCIIAVVGINHLRHKMYNIALRTHHTGLLVGVLMVTIVGLLFI